jgi:hypothetical protein
MSIVVPIDDYSPVLQGDTGKPFSILVLHKNGYEHILDADISMVMQSVEDPEVFKTCSGPWTKDPLDNGRASYKYQPEDVDTVGSWKMWVKIEIDGDPVHLDDGKGEAEPKILTIKALPSGV